jgi:hypothetical protein
MKPENQYVLSNSYRRYWVALCVIETQAVRLNTQKKQAAGVVALYRI